MTTFLFCSSQQLPCLVFDHCPSLRVIELTLCTSRDPKPCLPFCVASRVLRHKDAARSLSKTIDANLDCVIIKTIIFTLILDCKKQTKRKSYWPELTLTRQKERDGDHVKGPQSGLVCCFRLHRETKTLAGMAYLALRSKDAIKNNWCKLLLRVFFKRWL